VIETSIEGVLLASAPSALEQLLQDRDENAHAQRDRKIKNLIRRRCPSGKSIEEAILEDALREVVTSESTSSSAKRQSWKWTRAAYGMSAENSASWITTSFT
jgi:hypothetical protein